MAAKSLESPILNPEFPSIKFFNGRLLTGEDLSAEQAANREGRRRLGETIGEGIAYGLEVSLLEPKGPNPTVTVSAGVAVNRLGQTVVLANGENLLLVPPAEGNQADSTPVGFAPCQPTETGVYVAGEGIYLLTIAPAFGGAGLAPVSGLGNTEAKCNRKYILEGATFRLIQLDFKRDLNLSDAELNNPNQLRNVVAYKCFGVEDHPTQSFLSNPFGAQVKKYGVLDDLRPNRLNDCEVPLAIIYWTDKDGITFIDMWAVRRRIVKPASDESWLLLTSDRRQAEAEAMFLQFQEQIDWIKAHETQLNSIVATDRFGFLPPVGVVPTVGKGTSQGFNPQTFFGDRASKDVAMIDGNVLRSVLQEARYADPIDMQTSGRIQLYLIWENVKAVEQGKKEQLVLVFASQALPYRGVARFGYATWAASRFATRVI